MTDPMLMITECTRVAVVDTNGTVLGSDAGEILTHDDTALQDDLRGFGPGTLSIYLMPEWPNMTDAEIFHLPRSVPDLLAHGATLQRTVTL